MDSSITARRDRIDEQADEIYEDLYHAEREKRRIEWEDEFGANNPKFRFKPDVRALHAEVLRQMAAMRDQD